MSTCRDRGAVTSSDLRCSIGSMTRYPRRSMATSRTSAVRNLVVLLVVWELAGRFHWVAAGALPAPSAILLRLWEDRAECPQHVLASPKAAVLGFLIGNAIAVTAGAAFAIFPMAGRIAKGVNVAIFAVPPIALSPILVLTLSGMEPR